MPYLSEMSVADLLSGVEFPVEFRPDHYPTYNGDPFGDDPNEFGSVLDAGGNYLIAGTNAQCKLIVLALNALAEANGISLAPAPKTKGKTKNK